MADAKAPATSERVGVSRPMLGVLYMCAACALFPIMNGIVKLLAATYEPREDRRARHDALHEQFVATFAALRPVFHALNPGSGA